MFHYAPYGPAPWYCFPLMEFSIYFLFVICLRYAMQRSRRYVGYLLGGLVFGLMLEYVNVHSNLGYTYGRFAVMLGRAPLDIPLCIGVAWGIIMFSARVLTDELGLPLWAAAAVDALLAISIDISLDTVAYRLHMWNWTWSGPGVNPLTSGWFGVPYGNFFGWLMVVFFYSSFSRLLEKVVDQQQQNTLLIAVLTPMMAILFSEVALYMILIYADTYFDKFGIRAGYRCLLFMAVLLIIAGRGWRKMNIGSPAARSSSLPAVTWLVPLWIHATSFLWFFAEGFNREGRRMTAIAILNLLLALYVHTQKGPFYWRMSRRKNGGLRRV